MRNNLLATCSICFGLAALFYTACNTGKNETELVSNLQSRMESRFVQLKNAFDRLDSTHRNWVNEHAGLMGASQDSVHFRMETEHQKILLEDGQMVKHHQLTIAQKRSEKMDMEQELEALRQDMARLDSDTKKLQDDHALMRNAHQH